MHLGVIVPTYNRVQNLRRLLRSLAQQEFSNFSVVIADDGSTDETRVEVERLSESEPWLHRLKWVGCGTHQGFRAGRARNIAAGNLSPAAEAMVMLDSDLLLATNALSLFAEYHQSYPRDVIMGRVDWLPPGLAEQVFENFFHTGDFVILSQRVPQGVPHRIDGTFVGPELRRGLFEMGEARFARHEIRTEWSLVLNSIYPLNLFRRLGGFDEGMVGYGYECIELGARAAKDGVHCIAASDIQAVHVWHSKAPISEENQRNLDYVLRKHGPNEQLEIDIDWSNWIHYHRHRVGRIVRVKNQLWAINRTATNKLLLPDADWIIRLGFCPNEIGVIGAQEFDRIRSLGLAKSADLATVSE